MNEKTACEKFCQIISALEYCHNKKISHRDLKVIKIHIIMINLKKTNQKILYINILE